MGPNPISNGDPLKIYIENAEFSEVTIVLTDLYGRQVVRKNFHSASSNFQIASQEIDGLVNGFYYLDILFDGNKVRKKIVKIATN